MSGIVFQFSIIIGGVVTILVGLTLSGIILEAVAGASTYRTTAGENGVINQSSPLDVTSNCKKLDGNAIDLAADPPDRVECNLSGFMGSEAVLFLLPIIYYLFIIAIGLGMIGAGSLGVMGRGPTGGAGAR